MQKEIQAFITELESAKTLAPQQAKALPGIITTLANRGNVVEASRIALLGYCKVPAKQRAKLFVIMERVLSAFITQIESAKTLDQQQAKVLPGIITILANRGNVAEASRIARIGFNKAPKNRRGELFTAAVGFIERLTESNIIAAGDHARWCVENAPENQRWELAKMTVSELAKVNIEYAAEHARWCVLNAPENQREKLLAVAAGLTAQLAKVNIGSAAYHARWCVLNAPKDQRGELLAVAAGLTAELAKVDIGTAHGHALWCVENAPENQRVELAKMTVSELAKVDIGMARGHALWCVENAPASQRTALKIQLGELIKPSSGRLNKALDSLAATLGLKNTTGVDQSGPKR